MVPTNGSIDSRLGKPEIVNRYPTDASVKKLCDDMDYQRAALSPVRGVAAHSDAQVQETVPPLVRQMFNGS